MIILHYVSIGIGIAGVTVIVWGAFLILIQLIRLECLRFKGIHVCEEREELRHRFGSYLLMGMEFLIAADIIGTITHPTLMDMALLGSIVLIRTVISFFLDKELLTARCNSK